MACRSRLLLTAVAISTLLLTAMGHTGEAPVPEATFRAWVERDVLSSGGSGFTWGTATLIMADGSQHLFSIDGLGVRGNRSGFEKLALHGNVYHLQSAEDFAGTYKPSPPDAPAGADDRTVVLRNEHGVVVACKPQIERMSEPHLELMPSETGVNVTFVK